MKRKPEHASLSRRLEANIQAVKAMFKGDITLKARHFTVLSDKPLDLCALYLDGMADTTACMRVIQSLKQPGLSGPLPRREVENLIHNSLCDEDIHMAETLETCLSALMEGRILLLAEGIARAWIFSSAHSKKRQMDKTQSESNLYGPKKAFGESLQANLAQIRRIIRNPNLKFTFKTIGRITRTKVCLCYMSNLALTSIREEVEKRLDAIDIDGILDSGYLQELIRDHRYSPFETVGSSEKPDAIASKILEGRIAILVDGSPFVLTVPHIAAELSQASDDYYANFIFSSFNRLLRFIGIIGSMLIPALYLSILTYHPEILPTPVFISIAQAREGMPFPIGLSLILTLLIFDVIREAMARMVPNLSATMGFIGSLVLGNVLIEAHIVSAPVIIITGITGILALFNQTQSTSLNVVRYVLVIGAALLGIFGTSLVLLLTILHLMSLRSYGIPYFLNLTRLQDAWVRAPWHAMDYRPIIFGSKNTRRLAMEKKDDARAHH